jgi:hypothetical protein
MAANHEASFRMPPPFTEGSLLQGSPFLREGTGVPSPRRGVSSETPLPRERRTFHSPPLPGESMSVTCSPKRRCAGAATAVSIPPVPFPQYHYPQAPLRLTMASLGYHFSPINRPTYSDHALACTAYHILVYAGFSSLYRIQYSSAMNT